MNIHSNLNPIAPITPETSTSRVGNSAVPETRAAQTAATPPSNALGEDQAHLSQAAVLASAGAAGSDVRTEKVAAVQQALANGSYAVSPSEVAGKIIDYLLKN